MEEEIKKPHRWRGGGVLILAAVVVLLASGGWILFGWNQFYLELMLNGESAIDLDYGQVYQEPGCAAILRGTRLLNDGVQLDVPVEADFEVESSRVGKTVITYRAAFLSLEASARRVVRILDTVCPVITLTPDPEEMEPAAQYTEAGYTAWDNVDGDITDRVKRTEEDETIIYAVVDSSGNPTYVERHVKLLDTQAPEILLSGGDEVFIPLGQDFKDPGVTAWDRREGDLTDRIVTVTEGTLSRYRMGEMCIDYSVSDSSGNAANVRRVVHTVPATPPLVVFPREKTIYLTFDDGPCPDTVRLLDVLKQYNVKATFFAVDTGYPELLRRIVQEGHSLGIHTCSHNYRRIYADADSFFADILGMQDVIQEATGVQTWLLRFPGGSSNTISNFSHGIMTELTQMVEDAGFCYFDWNVDSEDAGGAHTAARVLANVKKGIEECPISIVLQHDIHPYSVDAVESILQWGLENGYQFLPLDTSSPGMHHPVMN